MKERKRKVGNEWLNILPKSSQARKKPPPSARKETLQSKLTERASEADSNSESKISGNIIAPGKYQVKGTTVRSQLHHLSVITLEDVCRDSLLNWPISLHR